MGKLRKLIAVIIGLVLLVVLRNFDVNIPGMDSVVLELAVSAATAFGVYQAKNDLV